MPHPGREIASRLGFSLLRFRDHPPAKVAKENTTNWAGVVAPGVFLYEYASMRSLRGFLAAWSVRLQRNHSEIRDAQRH